MKTAHLVMETISLYRIFFFPIPIPDRLTVTQLRGHQGLRSQGYQIPSFCYQRKQGKPHLLYPKRPAPPRPLSTLNPGCGETTKQLIITSEKEKRTLLRKSQTFTLCSGRQGKSTPFSAYRRFIIKSISVFAGDEQSAASLDPW